MLSFINSPLQIGSLTIPHRLIQGPLAGFSCAPFRELFNHFTPPAYAVSEMSSALDILHKHSANSRYVYRSPKEKILAYQISGTQENVMADAAATLQDFGADLIDINCGCPKIKIRKKGAGSALLENPDLLISIIRRVREVLHIPLTIKIRLQNNANDIQLAQQISDSGADA
ncbi:MAG: tRNA-dihydrouridine synthase family protein, partial [Legionella sp.]